MSLRRWLDKGPFSLSMSAGFFGFYSHCGFVKALWEAGYQPQRLMGSSAGALTGGLIGAGFTPHEIEKILLKFRKEHFWDVKLGLGLLEGKKFKQILEEHLPDSFDKLKIPFTAAVYDIKKLRTMSIDKGNLIDAVRASCCFPFLFHPVKMGNGLFIDGGVWDWMGMRHAPPDERVLVHFLEPTGLGSTLVKIRSFLDLRSHHYVFQLKNPMPMSPDTMHLAEEAIARAYEQTRKALAK